MTDVVALRSWLQPGCEPGYDAAHARVPDDLIEAHRRAGIRVAGHGDPLVEAQALTAASSSA